MTWTSTAARNLLTSQVYKGTLGYFSDGTEWFRSELVVRELKEDAKQYGHSWATIRRAADELGVLKPAGDPNSTWALPLGLLAELNGDGGDE